MTDKEFDLDKFHLKIVYAGEFPDPHYTNDLIEAAEEALATIEALRWRVAELEGERDAAVARYQNLAERHEPLIVKARKLNTALAVTVEGRESIIHNFQLSESHAADLRSYSLEIGKLRVLKEALTAENADLKRQVEALREAVTMILEAEMPDCKSQEEFGGYVLDDSIREKAKAALLKAAKGEVE